MMKKYSILSTFTGAGGLDLGFHGGFSFLNDYFPALPFKTDVAVEWSPFACGTLTHNTHYFNGIDVRNEDITKLNKKDLPQKNYDVLLGGFAGWFSLRYVFSGG
ncbi:MAG: DNA cytosine methyltransferase [Vampirovibrio sp.]|nr:DNA cytosine methyltransferase [Vampirovibrio sp.]